MQHSHIYINMNEERKNVYLKSEDHNHHLHLNPESLNKLNSSFFGLVSLIFDQQTIIMPWDLIITDMTLGLPKMRDGHMGPQHGAFFS